MLYYPGREVSELDGKKEIVPVKPFAGNSLVSFHLGIDTWSRETAFVTGSHLVIALLPGGVDHDKPGIIVPDNNDPIVVSYLICCQAGASYFGFAVSLGCINQVIDNLSDYIVFFYGPALD